MKTQLFQDFDAVSSKQWKQQIQFELKGADYNDTLIWESLEGIKVKPFYHSDDTISTYTSNTNTTALIGILTYSFFYNTYRVSFFTFCL